MLVWFYYGVFHVHSDGNYPSTTQVPVKGLAMSSTAFESIWWNYILSWSCVGSSVKYPTSPGIISKEKEEENKFSKQGIMY